MLHASILKVVSALVSAVLTVYVIGVFTSSSNGFYYVHFKYSLCPEFWCESCHFMLWILGGDFITKKEHNYCHFFSRSCYWQPTLLPWLMIRWTQHIHLNQTHTYAYAYQFCFGQFYPFQISLCMCWGGHVCGSGAPNLDVIKCIMQYWWRRWSKLIHLVWWEIYWLLWCKRNSVYERKGMKKINSRYNITFQESENAKRLWMPHKHTHPALYSVC